MDKATANELFEAFSEESGLDVIEAVVGDGLTVVGPSGVSGETFANILDEFDLLGLETTVEAFGDELAIVAV